MQQILIIGYVWPEPRSSAAGSRMLELIRLFRAQGWPVTFASPAATSEHMEDLAAHGVTAQSIELNNSRFDDFLRQLQPDLVLFDRFMMEEQFGWRVEQQCPDALRVLDTEDLHFLRHARQRSFLEGRELQRTDLLGERATREIAAIYRCDLTLIISAAELQILRDTFAVPDALLHYCPFMLPPLPTPVTSPAFSERRHFLSIGNFRHAPNWDAVLWLKQSLWPRIRQQLPQAELHIYGAYPPPKATALHQPGAGFHVLGWAQDVETVMAAARICLAPLRFGAGLKGKLADAMRCGTPNITTRIGAEGMAGELPWSGCVADSEAEFAAAAVRLYTQEDAWRQAQENGYQIVNQRFDGRRIGADLLAHLQVCREGLARHRLDNFTGAMLRHHHQKSTQYMAQWIEAKNRLAELQRTAIAEEEK